MSVDKKGIRDVARDNRGVVYVHIVDIVNDVDTFTLAGVSWLDNPNILL